ncbi:MAG: abortive infection family protein [Terracidiphilus sp.]
MTVQPEKRRFEMLGARAAIDGGLTHIQRQVTTLEEAIFREPALAFDLAKALVESVCKTILTERKVEYSKTDNMPTLFSAVSTILPFLPPDASGESKARESLSKTMNGLKTTLLGLSELRSAQGFTSHGIGIAHAELESTQALLAAQSADAIIGFFYSNHIRDRRLSTPPKPQYGQFDEFDEYIDSTFPTIRIFSLEYDPSEVLFYVDSDAYLEQLEAFNSRSLDPEDGEAAADRGQVE